MVRESPFPDIVARLHQNGYALLSGWRRQEATIAIGHSIGSVVDMRELLPRSKVPTVQTLVPRRPLRIIGIVARMASTNSLCTPTLRIGLDHLAILSCGARKVPQESPLGY